MRVQPIEIGQLRRSVALVVVVSGLTSLLWLAGYFETPAAVIYKAFARLVPKALVQERRVLLVESSVEPEVSSWPRIVDVLLSNGAERIVFMSIPSGWEPSGLSREARNRLFFGRSFVYDDPEGGHIHLQDVPPSIHPPHVGVIASPRAVLGIRRRQYLSLLVNDQLQPTIEAAVAGLPPQKGTFLVDLRGASAALPHISIERVLSGAVTRPLVSGRTIVIGQRADPSDIGVTGAPRSAEDARSSLVFHALAMDTLLRGQALREMSLLSGGFLLVAIAALLAGAYTIVSARRQLATLVICTVGLLLLGWSTSLFGWTLPLTALLLENAVLFLAFHHQRTVHETKIVGDTLEDLSLRLHDRVSSSTPFGAIDAWSKIERVLQSIVGNCRAAFWELGQDNRLVLAKTFGCEPENLNIHARKLLQPPFVTAAAQNSPLSVTDAFEKNGSPEREYLMRIAAGDQILGFWALATKELEDDSASEIVDFLNTKVTELFISQRAWPTHLNRERSNGSRGAVTSTSSMYAALRTEIGLLDSYVASLEKVFESSTVASVIYDLFGGVTHMNGAMREVVQHAKLANVAKGPVALLSEITRQDQRKLQKYIREVLVHQRSLSVAAELSRGPVRHVLVQIAPVQDVKRVGRRNALERSNANGCSIELQDVTHLHLLQELKQRLLSRFGARLRTDIQAFAIGPDLFADPRLDASEREELNQILKTKASHVVGMLEKVEKFVSQQITFGVQEHFPVDPGEAIRLAVASVQSKHQNARIALEVPAILPLVFASPTELSYAIEALLGVLAYEAITSANITIRVTSEPQWLTAELLQTGFGMPDEHLQEYLFGQQALPGEFEKARTAAAQIQSWGGTVEAFSTIGEQTRLRIKLETFL